MSDFEAADGMDLEKPGFSDDRKRSASSSCSICLELVLDRGERSIARLQCGHEFHLDCIGSAFNAKGVMQCPNCRKVEKGRWLYAHGHRSSSDFDFDGWVADDMYDYAELPLGYQWCPFGGFTQLASLFEDMEAQPNSYHEPLGSSSFADHPNVSGSAHICPYLALHGFPHPLHAIPSTSSDSVPENSHFRRNPTSLAGGQPPAEMLNSHGFSPNEVLSHNWQQLPLPLSIPVASNSDQQAASHYGMRLSRNDTNNQQRLASYIHSHQLPPGSITTRNGNNLVTGNVPPQVRGEARTHSRSNAGHIYHQPISNSPPHNSPFPSIRRPRPRGVAVISNPNSTSADTNGFYGFSVSSSSSRSRHDSGRAFDQFYGWGREGFAPLPWIPFEGESQWWGPFNPNRFSIPGSFMQRGGAGTNERASQSRSENGYRQRMPPPPSPPPPPHYM